MTLKRQLLLVSLLALMLPWAGCEFIRETESALRANQQRMLAGTAQLIADSMALHSDEFPARAGASHIIGDQLYGHSLETTPTIDGYFDDWPLDESSLRSHSHYNMQTSGQYGKNTYCVVICGNGNIS